jgi:hypothetical protein
MASNLLEVIFVTKKVPSLFCLRSLGSLKSPKASQSESSSGSKMGCGSQFLCILFFLLVCCSFPFFLYCLEIKGTRFSSLDNQLCHRGSTSSSNCLSINIRATKISLSHSCFVSLAKLKLKTFILLKILPSLFLNGNL